MNIYNSYLTLPLYTVSQKIQRRSHMDFLRHSVYCRRMEIFDLKLPLLKNFIELHAYRQKDRQADSDKQ